MVVGVVNFGLISVRKKGERYYVEEGGLEREVWMASKRGNGDMHAGVVKVEAQAHPILSKMFRLHWNI